MLDMSISTLTKAATQIAEALLFFIASAAATATAPFFRKNMGERYFTPVRAFLSMMAWIALFVIAVMYRMVQNGEPTPGIVVGFLIPFGYIGMSLFHLNAIQKRQATGVIWHSRSSGESLFGKENTTRDFIIELVVFIALFFVSFLHAGFFLLSRLMGYIAEASAQAALYNRYLDIQDGRIEAEFMETALRDGFPRKETAGLYAPLPSHIRGQRRANIARIVTGGPFIDESKPTTTISGTEQAQPPSPPVITPSA